MKLSLNQKRLIFYQASRPQILAELLYLLGPTIRQWPRDIPVLKPDSPREIAPLFRTHQLQFSLYPFLLTALAVVSQRQRPTNTPTANGGLCIQDMC